MTSDELNAAIAAQDSLLDEPIYDAFGGKPVPYFGWFWRRVDFDSPTCRFAVAPDDDGVSCVGFCEDNKWGYPEIEATPEQFAEIKRLLIHAATVKTAEAFAAADAAIQGVRLNAQRPR